MKWNLNGTTKTRNNYIPHYWAFLIMALHILGKMMD